MFCSGMNYSTTGFQLLLTRKMSFYIVTYYLPSGLFVVVSWIRSEHATAPNCCYFHLGGKWKFHTSMLSSSVCIVFDLLLMSVASDLGLLQEIQDEIYLSMWQNNGKFIYLFNHLLNQQRILQISQVISCRIQGWWTTLGHSSSKFLRRSSPEVQQPPPGSHVQPPPLVLCPLTSFQVLLAHYVWVSLYSCWDVYMYSLHQVSRERKIIMSLAAATAGLVF